jgi:pimeloyl-ACP methyl ester carboxylesterase
MQEKIIKNPAAVNSALAAKAPSWLLGILEVPRALSEAASLVPARSMLRKLPKGDGHTVITLPGFLASGRSMRIVRRHLRIWGYDAQCWNLGRNLGLTSERDLEALMDRQLHEAFEKSGEKVSLIGWSLGGLLAREVARRNQNMVRSVIMLGSPIGNPKSTNVWRLYESVSGQKIDEESIRRRIRTLRDPIEGIPMTAIYSRSDAVVSARIAQLPPGPNVENVGVAASHLGMGYNPAVLYVIADRLKQQHSDDWQQFEITGLRNLFYH